MEFHHRKLLLSSSNAPNATPLLPPLFQSLTNSFSPAASIPRPPSKGSSPSSDFPWAFVYIYGGTALLVIVYRFCIYSTENDCIYNREEDECLRDISWIPQRHGSGSSTGNFFSDSRRERTPERLQSASGIPEWHPSGSSTGNFFSTPHPLSKEMIQALPVFTYIKEASCLKDCVICLGEFEEEETVKKIPFCKHIFHPECLDKWLLRKPTCPLCRSTQIYVHGYANGEGPEQRSQRPPPQQVMQPESLAQGSPLPTISTQGINLSQFQEQGLVHHYAPPASSDEIVPAQGTLTIDLSQFQEGGSIHHYARPTSSHDN